MILDAATFKEEQVLRLAQKRELVVGPLSEAGFEELRLAVEANPAAYIDDPEEEAFGIVADAVVAYGANRKDDEFMTDQQYADALQERIGALRDRCNEAISIWDSCADAHLIAVLTADWDAFAKAIYIDEMTKQTEQFAGRALQGYKDGWDNVFLRPVIRTTVSSARMCAESAWYGAAIQKAERAFELNPPDYMGARYTQALAFARMEDEQALDQLDARFGRRGNAWINLARPLLFFKLDRLGAARRALKGFVNLNRGAAYVLLRPGYVEPYVPYRPVFEPGSFLEAVLATHEADPVIVDVPDFVDWCGNQDGVSELAAQFARESGFEW